MSQLPSGSSFPRRRESSIVNLWRSHIKKKNDGYAMDLRYWIPACAGMTSGVHDRLNVNPYIPIQDCWLEADGYIIVFF